MELEQQQKELSRLLSVAEQEAEERLTKDDIISILEVFKTGDLDSKDYQEALIDTFLVAAYVYDNEVRFIFNLGGEKTNATVPFNIDDIALSDVCINSLPGDQKSATTCVAADFLLLRRKLRYFYDPVCREIRLPIGIRMRNTRKTSRFVLRKICFQRLQVKRHFLISANGAKKIQLRFEAFSIPLLRGSRADERMAQFLYALFRQCGKIDPDDAVADFLRKRLRRIVGC